MARFLRHLAAWLRRDRLDDEMRAELAQHVAWKTQALVDEGVPHDEAHRRARLAVGNLTRLKEEARDLWGFPALETFLQDLRYGLRLLRRSPGLSAVAVLSLAIGIGASAAVFSLADAMLFRKLAVADPDSLVVLKWFSGPVFPFSSLNGYGEQSDDGLTSTSFSTVALEAFERDGSRYLDIVPFADMYQVNLAAQGVGEVGNAHAIGGAYFQVLGVNAAAGRTLGPADDRETSDPAAVISHAFARRRFGTIDTAIGRAVSVNGVPFTIAGVLPATFHGTGQAGTDPDVYVPLALRTRAMPDDDPISDPNFWWVLMMGRLKPGVVADDARAALDLPFKRTVAAAKPELASKDLPRLALVPGAHGQMEERAAMQPSLRAMAFVTAIVLMIACANVANLLLARGRARMREIAVRVAIGAPRRRVVRQLFTEALLLAAAGSVLGVLFATKLARVLLPALASGPDPLLARIGVDWRLLLFVVLVASTAAILFGLVPALRSSDVHLAAGLEEARRGATPSPRRRLLTGGLVVAQIALSVLLIAGAGLLVRSVRNLGRVDLGFNPHNLLLFRIDPVRNGYNSERTGQLYTTLLERLRATPGVQSASLSSHRLISNSSSYGAASRLDETPPPRRSVEYRAFGKTHGAYELIVDEQFFSTLSIPILRGRTFARADAGGELVAVVNRALALQLFQTDDVVGRQFRTNRAPYRIVGVCADARYTSLRRPAGPTAYLYYPQRLDMKGAPTFEVKTAGPPAGLASTVRDIVRSMDPTLPVAKIGTQAEQIEMSVATERLFAGLATLLGLVAVVLSAIGLHALLAYGVTQRRTEIGVRMALGADRSAVAWMILKQSLVLAAIGLVAGLAAAAAGMKVIQSLLFDLRVRDPVTLVTAAAIMLIVSATAGYLPARRAARVDPLVALRAD